MGTFMYVYVQYGTVHVRTCKRNIIIYMYTSVPKMDWLFTGRASKQDRFVEQHAVR